MNTGYLAKRYAAALLDYADKAGQQADFYEEAKQIVRDFSRFGEVRTMLVNPLLPHSEKRKIMLYLNNEKTSLVYEKLADLLLKNHRETYLLPILLKYIDLYREQHKILHGKLTTAVAIDSATEKKIIAITEKTVEGTFEIEKETKPDILGGFLLEIDFYRWDASLVRQLQEIKENL